MDKKKCCWNNCEEGEKLLPLSQFYKKGNRLSSRCKNCENKIKRENRMNAKNTPTNEILVLINPSVDKKKFAEILSNLILD